jgi:hypothetical protein
VLNVSNDEPAVEGETDEQRQLRELCNTGHADTVTGRLKKTSIEGDPDQEI